MSHGRAGFSLTRDDVSIPSGHAWTRLPSTCLAICGIGAVATAGLVFAGGAGAKQQFFFSYLVSFLYWLSLALGGLFFVIVQHAARAGWSVAVRRFAESMAAPLWIFAPLFVVVVLGMHDLYHWTHEAEVARDHVLQHKRGYLNTPFFLIRAAVYFAVWGWLGYWYWKKSVTQDETGENALTRRMQYFSGPALVGFAFTISFAAFDWIMGLEPHWFSTMFGVYYFSGALIAVFAALILVAMAARRLTRGAYTVEHFHDLGKLLFAFTVFWAYIAFSQYMLIWYANIPEETTWYAQRWAGSWRQLSVVIGVGHFAVPFFYLMGRDVKRLRFPLVAGAVWMLLIHLIDIYWLVMPTHHRGGAHFSLLDVSCFIAIGGLYLSLVTRSWQGRALIPLRDPRLGESVAFENF